MQCQIVRKSFQRVGWLCAWMIACPQFKNSFVLNYKGFFYGKEVRKAQPFSGMLWFAWDFGHPPLKFVFCQCKGCPTLRGTHATSIFGKYLFGRLFEIQNFRNISCEISCLPASPKIFEHLKNGIIPHFKGIFTLKSSPRIFGSLCSG